MIRRLAALLLAALPLAAAPAAAAAPAPLPVIIDNDWSVAGGAMAIMPVLASPRHRLLGLTAVIGDSYVPESTAHTLDFLALIGRTDIPVLAGANQPLLRSKSELAGWEARFGALPYRGAWADPKPGDPAPPPVRHPALRVAPGTAAEWLVAQARAHPGLSILAAGPLTNIALATALDPQFASHVGRLVIMGGMVDTDMARLTRSANFFTDFNFLFDPEAADAVLRAGFGDVVIVGTVSNETLLTKDHVARIAALGTPLARYYAQTAWVGLPLWDELAAAILVRPDLVTRSTTGWMRVNTDGGMDYGRAHVWPEAGRPHRGEGRVTIVEQVDLPGFYALFDRALGLAGR
ncbi:nucleoside hydrolase [Sphingomonas morindae]|uniref:Nucleoside hydrolase n=1 Tax=Sphingomonas morindae TaxID=1541170 RepID=A0ABY4XAW5_9SPHN|nr:nucleoside hydrolase [Sphingomonas morindae]USI74063.1 nucleoside hydrolase [Sphingomonas morindae]